MTREELLAAVEAWEGVAERVSQAIAERDHRRCVVANREGDKLFREVKIYIKQLDGAAMEDDLKTLVMAAMGRWLEVANAATLLNEDIRREIDSIRRRRKNGRNIGQMYLGQGSPSGRNLRIKAK